MLTRVLLPRRLRRVEARRARAGARALACTLLAAAIASTPAIARTGTLKFATFNTWNVNEPYASRIDHAIEVLRGEAPDVVGLQEVYLDGVAVPFRADERIAAALRMDAVQRAAATVPLGDGTATEGLALLSRHPIVSSSFVQLPSGSGGNGRIVLQGTVSTPYGLVDCYVTHLSTNGSERDEQAQALLAFVRSVQHDSPPVVLGDLNAQPLSPALLFLTGVVSAGGTRGDFRDVWALLNPGDPGSTFATANAHGQQLDRRLDFVLVGHGIAPEPEGGPLVEVHRAFDVPDASGIFPSDHLGVVATLRFEGEPPPGAQGSGGGCQVAPREDRRGGAAAPALVLLAALHASRLLGFHRSGRNRH